MHKSKFILTMIESNLIRTYCKTL